MTDPHLFAALDIVRQTFAEMRECIAGLPDEALNWNPAGDDSNSVAVLAIHSMHSTRWWLCVATLEPPPYRDRESEFRTSASDGFEVLTAFDEIASDCLALLEPSRAIDWSGMRQWQSQPNPTDTAAWALIHAVEHLREHLGQIQLTRQLWEQTHYA
jgi:hypothetical protein